MLQKIRDVLIESRLVETMIFKKMVVAIGAGVIKANEPKKIEGIWMRSGTHSRLSSKSFRIWIECRGKRQLEKWNLVQNF